MFISTPVQNGWGHKMLWVIFLQTRAHLLVKIYQMSEDAISEFDYNVPFGSYLLGTLSFFVQPQSS